MIIPRHRTRARRCDPARRHQRSRAGVMLVECLIYLSVWGMITGLAFSAFYSVLDNSRRLHRNADDIARSLHAGEVWREDVRRAVGPIEVVRDPGLNADALRIRQRTNEVVYAFTGTNVLRRATRDGRWTEALAKTKNSRMVKDQRQQVTAWRWEFELASSPKHSPVMRPIFMFEAVGSQQQ